MGSACTKNQSSIQEEVETATKDWQYNGIAPTSLNDDLDSKLREKEQELLQEAETQRSDFVAEWKKKFEAFNADAEKRRTEAEGGTDAEKAEVEHAIQEQQQQLQQESEEKRASLEADIKERIEKELNEKRADLEKLFMEKKDDIANKLNATSDSS